jgi:hypothetical protein
MAAIVKIPNREYRIAASSPIFRKFLYETSIDEEEENSFYDGMLDTLSDHCCGTFPRILGSHGLDEINDDLEDELHLWCIENQIGSVIRQVRRDAALTGIGIALPYIRQNTDNQIKLGYKAIDRTQLCTPMTATHNDRIYDGIEYDKNWDISAIHISDGSDTKEYKAKDIIVWFKQPKGGMTVGVPECGAALCLYPSVRRVMNAIVRGEEFTQSIPMAIQLDPNVYGKSSVEEVPSGEFKYEPGMVPTLPVGTSLVGVPGRPQSAERTKFIELVVGAAARCIQMPKSLAMGDSSNSNMSVASYDVQPWENKIRIDRSDFEIVPRKMYNHWMRMVELKEGFLTARVRSQISKFRYDVGWDYVFKHPDPNKNANARLTDLISGSTTLYSIYTGQCKNPRRELQREAKLLGVEYKELIQVMLACRTSETLKILGILNEQKEEESQDTKQRQD